MQHPLRLCLVNVDAPLVEAFTALGHQVLLLSPPGDGTLHLPTALAEHNFVPDAVLQQEMLGPRLLLTGLETVPGLRAFWARDPHLNGFWQAAYARLFDLTFSTQHSSLADLSACGAERVLHLPWYAPNRPFRPFAQRTRAAGFAGRLSPMRPARTWLAETMNGLLGQNFALIESAPFEQMLDFYMDCRLVPNESLAGEVNFRLFEAAGCGCVVLAQNLGQEQAALLTPGREMLVCANALELAETVALLEQRPRLAEAMGRAAWERIQADHLPESRAATIIQALRDTPERTAATGELARRMFLLTLAGLAEAERYAQSVPELLADLATSATSRTEEREALLAAQLRVSNGLCDPTTDDGALETALTDALSLCRSPGGAGLPLTLTCAMLALRRAVEGIAQAHWLALTRELTLLAGGQAPPEATPRDLLLAWARLLQGAQGCHGAGLPTHGGFPFEPGRHLPATAGECLHWASALAQGDTEILRELVAHVAARGNADGLLLGVLSDLSLRLPSDWRVGLATGLCDLRVFRATEGLSELALALANAQAQGQAEDFTAELTKADPSGRIRRTLSAFAAP